jgi:spheroidene monooxygenase
MQPEDTSIVLLIKFKSSYFLWGLLQLAFGRFFMRKIPGLNFFKLLGSGKNGGFSLKPGLNRQGLFCCFQSDESARNFLKNSMVVKRYKKRSDEFFSVELKSYSTRGTWSQNTINESISVPTTCPIASLTRASIKITKAKKFWSLAPDSENSLRSYEGCFLSAGLGEAPILRQATFSMWTDPKSLNDYARTGAHLKAIKLANQEKFFSESMFVRFKPINPKGVWRGKTFG